MRQNSCRGTESGRDRGRGRGRGSGRGKDRDRTRGGGGGRRDKHIAYASLLFFDFAYGHRASCMAVLYARTPDCLAEANKRHTGFCRIEANKRHTGFCRTEYHTFHE
jgi:hypothetical protein